MIVYASLEPFSGWMSPLPDTPFFLFEPWPPHFTRFDLVINVVAYAPFGFLLGAGRHAAPAGAALATAIGAGALLSFAMESTQMFLPTRDASSVDCCPTASARPLAGCWRLLSIGLQVCAQASRSWRYRTFLDGPSGDLGLALLGVWLLSQVNPAIPSVRGDL